MVLTQLIRLLTDRYGCDPEDITMGADFDVLNVTEDERMDVALILWELFLEAPFDDVMPIPDTVEDLVGYIEDRLG